ncbi:hypothetical protein ACIOEX_01515 [Streptomyces sp. NPDC087850]|uniref:hypothetical protein n=1 Tax=Streptomyces sp. NPDC087850 TaxID=3365809 RepID=UPI0037FB0584
MPIIAALTTRTIASFNHPGHDLEHVGRIITSDAVLELIRTSYNRHTSRGLTPKDAVIKVGQTVIATYCNRAGIPTG